MPVDDDRPRPGLASQLCEVFEASDIYVSIGVNVGDGLDIGDELCPGDIYELDEAATPAQLALRRDSAAQIVDVGSEVGTPGSHITLTGRLMMMAPDGDQLELLLLRHDADGRIYVLPTSPIGAHIDYTLVDIDNSPQSMRLADLLCVSFARGTLVTLGNGEQCPIESLSPGMRVLTRDHGQQELRWIGKTTLRAVGTFAPVVIAAGAHGNEGDLIVSQHHRMFLYQRHLKAGVPQAELLVQAKYMVNGDTVFIREGGFVDYFSLAFDNHEIIYVEGIPAESLLVSEATVSRLPPELASDVKTRFPGLNQDQHFGIEADPELLAKLGLKRR